MKGYRQGNRCCYHLHPKEEIVGVCPLCLNERLLIIASSRQGQPSSSSSSKGSHGIIQGFSQKKPPINLSRIFALSSLLNRLEFFSYWKSGNSDDLDVLTSQEDSFISIKFEENGVASWEKGTVNSKVSLMSCPTLTKDQKEANTSVIEHARPHASLRWRKQIGQLFRFVRWKRSSKANMYNMGSEVDGVKVMRKGRIKTMTNRTKE